MPTDEQLAVDLLARTAYGRVATSLRALPFLACARHVVVDGALLLRMHRGHGHHRACAGHVVAYGTDNLNAARPDPGEGWWSVQVVGECTSAHPTPAELELFGPAPRHTADGTAFDPVYLRVVPRLARVERADATRA
ncbi:MULTISPECIES: pyridoxamine 5'-phosphate oxidase family protein [unclassified Streptomyces]|uniref:pyridoxamine 5'-phosphate oxidase family protein n=1 Tax=unclassified Streptomyces TaxID=2593676 RepID=UPI0037FACF38